MRDLANDFKNFQEFFISEGWGESTVECERLGKFPGILHFSGVGGSRAQCEGLGKRFLKFPGILHFWGVGGAAERVSDLGKVGPRHG